MAKRIIAFVCIVLFIVAIGFGAWWFFLRPTPLKGDVEFSHTVTLNLHDNIFYDVLIPNEAKLEKTDEHYTYEYDLLKVGVRDTEPLDADYKVRVDGRWVYAYSADDWLKTIAYSVENNKPYTVNYAYEYTYYTDPETGGEVLKDWVCGPAPQMPDNHYNLQPDTYLFDVDDYLIYKEQYGQWDVVTELMCNQLVQATKTYMPEHYDTGIIFYAESNGVTVGVRRINFNTQFTVFAKGPQATERALDILTKGVG